MVVLLLPLFMKTATERRVVYFHYLKKMYPKLQKTPLVGLLGTSYFKGRLFSCRKFQSVFFSLYGMAVDWCTSAI
jgi:hypothetical protein